MQEGCRGQAAGGRALQGGQQKREQVGGGIGANIRGYRYREEVKCRGAGSRVYRYCKDSNGACKHCGEGRQAARQVSVGTDDKGQGSVHLTLLLPAPHPTAPCHCSP